MEFSDAPEEAAFRVEVRSFIEQELDDDVRRGKGIWSSFDTKRDAGRSTKGWRKKLADRAWIAPAWPTEYGGAGMSIMQQFIF
ncbi:MAG: acyl-CoA dehydrogenase family protein, partial [Proteobacteria bacterium]|nr:acyl-CoA dehydrogenase family protein [Pseudomonadota bacterium]